MASRGGGDSGRRGGGSGRRVDGGRLLEMAVNAIRASGRGVQPSPSIPYSAAPPDPPRPDRSNRLTPPAASSPEKSAIVPQPRLESSSLNKAAEHPQRPQFVSTGERCIVKANHFLVKVKKHNIYQYNVAITPEVKSRTVCRSIISQLVFFSEDPHPQRMILAYDGRRRLYTAGKLPANEINLPIECCARNYDVVLTMVCCIDSLQLQQLLQGTQHDAPRHILDALDIVLRECPSSKYANVSRSFYSPMLGNFANIGKGVESWGGYCQSLRPTQMGLSLNIDSSVAVFSKSITVVDFATDYLHISKVDRPLKEKDHVKLAGILQGVRVSVKNTPYQHKIAGLTTKSLRDQMFTVDDRDKIYVTEYYSNKHNIKLEYLSWPCLQVGSKKKEIYLPIELCTIIEGQKMVEKYFDPKEVAQFLNKNFRHPSRRSQDIHKLVRQISYDEDNHALEFGINVSNDMVSVEARVLRPPMLQYHESGKEKSCVPQLGTWNMLKKKMVNGGLIKSWACISFSSSVSLGLVQGFCQLLVEKCRDMGMEIEPVPVMDCLRDSPSNVNVALNNLFIQVERKLDLLIIVLPEEGEIYCKIKKLCETDLGIVSQCCKSKNIRRSDFQLLESLALKINAKVGGRNTVLQDAILYRVPVIRNRLTIVFGADVTHPSPGDYSSPSIAAIVASMDWPEVTRYKCLVSAQSPREEIIRDQAEMVRELLLDFKRTTGDLPIRIIFYRDGVGEGDFDRVLANEVIGIKKACISIVDTYNPSLSFIVVQKRHHTRFFPSVPSNGNVLPGTVVDRKICHPAAFDFYLCSHASVVGTSKPTHYHVLYDENTCQANDLQNLTNYLCYTCVRCTRSVSLVPPVHYAHLAAYRARCYVEGESESQKASATGTSTTDKPKLIKPLPKIKDRVKELMFYC